MKKPIIALAFLFILACKKQEIKQLNTENSDLEIQKAKNPAEYLTITNSYLTENTENIKIPNFVFNIFSIIFLLLSIISIISSTFNPFIYFRF